MVDGPEQLSCPKTEERLWPVPVVIPVISFCGFICIVNRVIRVDLCSCCGRSGCTTSSPSIRLCPRSVLPSSYIFSASIQPAQGRPSFHRPPHGLRSCLIQQRQHPTAGLHLDSAITVGYTYARLFRVLDDCSYLLLPAPHSFLASVLPPPPLPPLPPVSPSISSCPHPGVSR